MTGCCGSTWRHRDGSMWPGSTSSDEKDLVRGLDLIDLRIREFKVGCFEPSEWSQARPSYPAKALTQAVPFQCAISLLVVDTAVSWSPTAQASLPERALTPERPLAGAPGTWPLFSVRSVPPPSPI